MYNLKIKSGSTWYDADLANDVNIAITFEEAGMAEAKVKCSGTQSIELPKTPTNDKIFGYIANEYVSGRGQYKVYQCVLLYDTIELFGMGSRLTIISSDERSYSVVVTAPTSELFTVLEGIDFNGEQKTCLGYANASDNTYVMTAGGDGYPDASASSYDTRLQGHPIDKMIDKLSTVSGYNLSALKNSIVKQDSIRLRSKIGRPWEEYFMQSANKQSAIAKQLHIQRCELYTGIEIDTSTWNSATLYIMTVVRVPASVTTFRQYPINIECTKSQDATHVMQSDIRIFEMSSPPTETDEYGNKYAVALTAVTNNSGKIQEGGANGASASWLLSVGDKFRLYNAGDWYYQDVDMMFFFLLPGAAKENADAVRYQHVYLAQNLGYKNALEFCKALFQMNGIISRVEASTLITYKYDDIIANAANARDWSEFVLSFSKSYHDSKLAQRNDIMLKANTETQLRDMSSFTIDDETLKPQATYLDFNAETRKTAGTIGQTPNAPVYLLPNPWPGATSDRRYFHYMTASDIIERYGSFIDSMQEYKMIKAKMIIPITEMLHFDHRVPIFLRQCGRYFYVKKISNWMIGKVCDVELLQLTF